MDKKVRQSQILWWIKDRVESIEEASEEVGLDEEIISLITNDYQRCAIGWVLNDGREPTSEGYGCDGPVCVKKSGNRGLGLFATRDVEIGETITHYPIDAVMVKYKNKDGNVEISTAPSPGLVEIIPRDVLRDELRLLICVNPDSQEDAERLKAMNKILWRMKEYGFSGGDLKKAGIGELQYFASPDRPHDPYYLGHLFNDGGFNPLKKGYDILQNNVHTDSTHTIRAARKVKKGDEFLLPYGEEYWYGGEGGECVLLGRPSRARKLELEARKNRRDKKKRSRSNKSR